MSRYFLDTEFHEYPKKRLFGKAINTIDLISIGMVSEDGREYYAISKDFNLKDAWNSWQPKSQRVSDTNFITIKEYWLRENVLLPVLKDLMNLEHIDMFGTPIMEWEWETIDTSIKGMSYRYLKRLLKKYGKSNKEIAEEIIKFTEPRLTGKVLLVDPPINEYDNTPIEFYAYYADYDWVVFCWLFGRMIDLPDGFPMYCKDLKQISDEVYEEKKKSYYGNSKEQAIKHSGVFLNKMSDHLDYPRQQNEHNALDDAKWDFELYKFLTGIKTR